MFSLHRGKSFCTKLQVAALESELRTLLKKKKRERDKLDQNLVYLSKLAIELSK